VGHYQVEAIVVRPGEEPSRALYSVKVSGGPAQAIALVCSAVGANDYAVRAARVREEDVIVLDCGWGWRRWVVPGAA
jgi:hypothetical protein